MSLPAVPAAHPARGFSVALKLTLFVAALLALLFTGLLVGSGLYWRGVLRRQVDAHLSALAISRRDTVHAQLQLLLQRTSLDTDRGEFRGYLQEIARGEAEQDNARWSRSSLLHIKDDPRVVEVAMVSQEGMVMLASPPGAMGRDVSATPEFLGGLMGTRISPPQFVHGRYQAIVSAPIESRVEPKVLFGVLLTTVDVTPLAAAVQELAGLGSTGETLLGQPYGEEIRLLFPARNRPDLTTLPINESLALAAAVHGEAKFFRARDYRGVPALAVSEPIPLLGWGLVVKIDQAEAYAPITRALLWLAAGGVLVMLLGLPAVYGLALRFTRPVRHLAEAATQVAGGALETQVPVLAQDELGQLGVSFNAMTRALHARQRERDAAAAALQQADRRKDEFLAMLGHELRNPLSAIAAATQVWREEGVETGTGESAPQLVERQTTHLVRLVDDLLDVARINEGKIALRKEAVEVHPVLQGIARVVQPEFIKRRQQLTLLAAAGEPQWVLADRTRLEQVVTNLLTNASKYTPEGGHIALSGQVEQSHAVIVVQDDGVGLAPEMLEQVFELFTQADTSLDRSVGGLGLGLSLSRRLVEMHGGTITAASPGLGQGATFTVRLPLTPAPVPVQMPAALPPVAAGPGRRILLVDDNVDTVRLLSRLLQRRGFAVATAYDGLAAPAVAQEFQPEILLLDLGLPGQDGYTLARQLRAGGFADALMVAISGYAQEADRARSRAAGFDHHLAKPVDFSALHKLLAHTPQLASA